MSSKMNPTKELLFAITILITWVSSFVCVKYHRTFGRYGDHIFIKKRRPFIVSVIGWIALFLLLFNAPFLLALFYNWIDAFPLGTDGTHYVVSVFVNLNMIYFNLICFRYVLLYFDQCYQAHLISWKWLLIAIDSTQQIGQYKLPWSFRLNSHLHSYLGLLIGLTIFIAILFNMCIRYVIIKQNK